MGGNIVMLWLVALSAIDSAIVLKALKWIWTTKTETATRVRQRIEAVVDYAAARRGGL